MKVSINFHTAPPLSVWQEALTPNGWKITKYTESTLSAKNEFGESKFPIRNATSWYITVQEKESGVKVEMNVPAFADSDYAENRMRRKVADISSNLDNDAKTDDLLTVDVLERLREYHEST
jgi:hypothetical protein